MNKNFTGSNKSNYSKSNHSIRRSSSDEAIPSTRKLDKKTGSGIKRADIPKNEVKQTQLHLRKIIQEHYNQDVDLPKEYRRLDSLARLTEGSGTCAAAYFDGEKILIASNDLKSTSRERGKTKDFINEVLNYYLQLVAGAKLYNITELREMFNSDRIKLFKNICVQNIHDTIGKAGVTNCDEYISKFAEYVLSREEDPLSAKNTSLNEFERIIERKVVDVQLGMLFGASIVAIPRLARDFIKLEYYFTEDGKNMLGLKKAPVIIQHGTTKLHAEMQVIQDAINNKIAEIGYIGISKLCCLDCVSLILAINTKNDPDQLSEEANIMFRGQHNICFKNNWGMPEFLEKDQLLKTLYFKAKEHIQDKYVEKEHSSMMPIDSESPPTARKNIIEDS